MEVYRHQVGGHSRFMKPRDSQKVLKPFSQTEYEFYERLSQLGSTSTDSGPLHILKQYVPEYYGVTEVQIRVTPGLGRLRPDLVLRKISRRSESFHPVVASGATDNGTNGYRKDISSHFSRRRHCDSASCLSDYKGDDVLTMDVAEDIAYAKQRLRRRDTSSDADNENETTLTSFSGKDMGIQRFGTHISVDQLSIPIKLDPNSASSPPGSPVSSYMSENTEACSHQKQSDPIFYHRAQSNPPSCHLEQSDSALSHHDHSDSSIIPSWCDATQSCSTVQPIAPVHADASLSPILSRNKFLIKTNNESSNTIVLKYIILQDLVYMYKKPCVLDLKMGQRQRKIGASTEKERSQLEKSLKTTSHSLGFRLCGYQVSW